MKITPLDIDQNWKNLTDEQKFELWNFASSRLFYFTGNWDTRVAELTTLTADWGLPKWEDDGKI